MSAQNGLSNKGSEAGGAGASSTPPASGASSASAAASASSAAAPSASGVAVQGEEFQRYLEKSGVIDALTKVLVGLYESPEKPSNAIDYVKEWLGVSVQVSGDGGVQSMLDGQQRQLADKDAEIAQLRRRVQQLEEQAERAAAAAQSPVSPSSSAGEEGEGGGLMRLKVDAPTPQTTPAASS